MPYLGLVITNELSLNYPLMVSKYFAFFGFDYDLKRLLIIH